MIRFVQRATGEIFRVLQQSEQGLWLISFNEPAAPLFVSAADGLERIETPASFLEAQQRTLTPAEQRRLALIQPLLDDGECIIDRGHRLSMLTYFPTPYPHEWWYSILCRYHVRSGRDKQQTTVMELFGRERVPLGSVFPNGSIHQVCSRLPSELFPVREMILRHTLFPFYMRCQSLPAKEDMLGKLCRGEMAVITSIRRFAERDSWRPRYCPCCAAEEDQELGETYWHVDHQIPLMSHCPVHKCRLVPVEALPMAQLDYSFFPLSSFDLAPPPLQQDTAPGWQLPLSQILHDYQALPHIASATEGHSNLAITLSNLGYGSHQKASQHILVNAKKVYHDMVDCFGEYMMEKIFGGEKGLCIINRACKWAVATPERYALMQCFANLDSITMFSTVKIEDRLESKLKEFQGSGITYTKKQIIEQLKITSSQLDILARKYKITPFWQRGGGEEEGQHKLGIVLNDEEYRRYKAARNASGFRPCLKNQESCTKSTK